MTGGPGEPPTLLPSPQVPWLTRAKGWLLGVILFFSALLGSFFILSFLIPLLFLAPTQWRRLVDRLVAFWVAMPGPVLELIWGSKVRVVGHKIEHSEPALIIMNHRSRLDWLFFWTALYSMDPWLLVSEKISLKSVLKYIPGAGWAMQCSSFLFLDRQLQADKDRVDRMIDYYSNSGFNYQVLLFPEGTDKCPKATKRSEDYALSKNLPHYNYLLHTKTGGFTRIVQRMRKNGYIKYLYDVTVGFGECIVQSEVELITHGLAPTDIHYQVVKIDINDLPQDDEGLNMWLMKHWERKEEQLKQFYCRDNPDRTTFPIPKGGQEFEMTPTLRDARIFIISFWLIVSVVWTYFAFVTPFVPLIAVLSTTFFVGCQYLYGGVEWLAIKKQEDYIESKRNNHVKM